MTYRSVVAVLALVATPPSLAFADCRGALSPDALGAGVERIVGSIAVSPMVCANTPRGIYCGSVGSRISVTVTGAYLGNRTSVDDAFRVRSCVVGSNDPACRFTIDFDALRIQASRRADVPGWKMVEIAADRIDLMPAACR